MALTVAQSSQIMWALGLPMAKASTIRSSWCMSRTSH
ncbi:rCG61573 [Rattus norvegicus]|uniref:RCG61573 n=1 Tax=Rattus norvegicus TaxID=10116 RepID=A6HBC3_RAT|nr:rCG61573 [Rattus norvegicus]